MVTWLQHTGSALRGALRALLGSQAEGGADALAHEGSKRGGRRARLFRFASDARRSAFGAGVLASACWTPGGLKVAAVRLGPGREEPACDYLEIVDQPSGDGPPSEAQARAAGERLSGWLAATVEKLGGWLAGVILVIPRKHVSVRYVKFPSSDPDQITQMAGYQLHQLVPFERGAAAYAAVPVLRHEDGSSTAMVSVIRREVLDSFLAVAGGLPVAAVLVDAEASALASKLRSAEAPGRQQGHGALVAERDGKKALLYVQGDIAPVSFSRSLQLSEETADALAQDIATSAGTFASRVPGARLDKVLLVNWGAMGAELAASLRSAVQGLEIEEIVEPPARPRGEGGFAAGLSCGPAGMSFRAAVGPLLEVGGWKTDLNPPESRRGVRVRGLRRQLAATVSLAAALVLLLTVLSVVRVTGVQREISRMEKKLVVLEPAAHRAERMDRALRDLTTLRQGVDLIDAMAELSSLTPSSAKVSSLSYQKGRFLDFTGTAASLDEVLDAARRLEDSPLFGETTVRYANARSGRQQDVTDFRMVLTMGGGER